MATRVSISPSVLSWAVRRSGRDETELAKRFPALQRWSDPKTGPTTKQLQSFSKFTGIAFGYLLLPNPPELGLPIADFREGHTGKWDRPSTDLLAVLYQSVRRQEWYRDYALESGLPTVEIVGAGAASTAAEVASDMRERLDFQVDSRSGTWNESRRSLLSAFEELGGLTVTTSMVGNNAHRILDPDEFRGFSLVDDIAPLIFVNAAQTLNGQIFTLAHEFAHVWLGTSGISAEDIRREADSEIEAWCNAVASEFLVPVPDLRERYPGLRRRDLTARLDSLTSTYRCGTLVVLQSIHRAGLEDFADFDAVYDQEVRRLAGLEKRGATGRGDHYLNQPYRIGDRLSRALIGDAIEGRTELSEALRLMSMKSLHTFDEYARRLGVA